MRVLITGGGTGGHVYPALAIIQQFLPPSSPVRRAASGEPASAEPDLDSPPAEPHEPNSTTPAPADVEPMYIGSTRGLERELVPRTGIPSFFLPMSPPSSLRGVALLARATAASLQLILRHRPDATIATGGYASIPAALASWLARVPLVLFLPDVVPGRAVSFLAPLASRVAVATEAGGLGLPAAKTVVTGYPVRQQFFDVSREDARRYFDLPPDMNVLCVFGGSQGSRSINAALARSLPHLLSRYQVLHICGEKRLQEAETAAGLLTPEQRGRYQLFPYLHDDGMARALAAADLVIARAGASTLGELPATGTPAVLVPLPEGRVHQKENAEALAAAGAAVVVPDEALDVRLTAVVDELFGNPERLERMRAAASSLRRPDAAADIAGLVRDVLR